jgi:glycosyltransferase involved in cell wall biosynthesis
VEVHHISCLAVFERYKLLRDLRLILSKDVYEENKGDFWIMIVGLRHDLDAVYGLRGGLPKIVSIERKYGVRMKVCLVSNTEKTWIIQDFEILKELGYEVRKVITRATFDPYRILKLFFETFRLACWSDVIYCWFAFPAGFAGAIIGKIARKPVIVNAVGGDVAYVPMIDYGFPLKRHWRLLLKWTLKNADKVIAISQESAKNAKNIVSTDVEVIYEGINVEKFRPVEVAKPKQDIILSVGVMSKSNLKRKGFEIIVKSIPYVVKEFKNVKFVFVGAKEDGYPMLRKLAEKLGVLGYVDFAGYKSDEELVTLFNQCAIFACPSIHEGFPTVISEALACEKPIIGTRLAAIPEVVVNNETGILLENAQSVEELAQAILTLLRNPLLGKEMGKKGRALIVERFSREIRKQKLMLLLRSFVA